jgi:uncharacterized OB-fold protein
MERHLGDGWVLPSLTPHSTPYFTAGTIQIQFCEDCGHAQHPPDDLCLACQGRKLVFRAMPGTGRVESAAIVRHAVHPALADRVPYVIAIVSVDGAPGCNVQGNVVGCAPDAVAIGQRVRAVFEHAKDPQSGQELRIPQWELAPDA